MSQSVSEGERLKSVCCELEEQVKSTLSQLDEEKERCRCVVYTHAHTVLISWHVLIATFESL